MSGLKGALDDAYTHAEGLRTALNEAVYAEDGWGACTWTEVARLFGDATDLASRISNLSNQLRS